MDTDTDIWRWMYTHTHTHLIVVAVQSLSCVQLFATILLRSSLGSALDKNHLIAFLTSGSAFGTIVILYLYSWITSRDFESFVAIKFSYFNKRTYKIFYNYNGIPRLLNWTAFAWRV